MKKVIGRKQNCFYLSLRTLAVVVVALAFTLIGCNDVSNTTGGQAEDYLNRFSGGGGGGGGGLYTLTVNTIPADGSGGTVSRNPNQTSFVAGTNAVVTLVANAQRGYIFKNWTGASTATTDSIQIIMDGNKTVTAVFEDWSNWSTFTDARDNKTYRVVVIGGMLWMAENLNYRRGV